jgi:hypothetical protein
MPYYTRLQCPACGNAIQTPVQQILDVRANPELKRRVLSGAVNVAQCPYCGWAGGLNLPFIYHDPENETALLYLPLEAGKNEQQRQQAAGKLIRRLQKSLPAEERASYLLNPETFVDMEAMIQRVLELEGVTPEDMELAERRQLLLQQLLNADPEEWEELVEENEDLIEASFFQMLNYNLQVGRAMQQQAQGNMVMQDMEQFEKLEQLQEFLVEHHPLGRQLEARTKVVRPFMEDPNRDTLLEALLQAPDDGTIRMLVEAGSQMMDYAFFQKLNERIEAAEDEDRRAELKALRRKILDTRDELVESSQAVLRKRGELLEKLLETQDPLKMARSHLSELDEAFSYVLQSEMQRARQMGDDEYAEELNALVETLDQLMESSMPPEVALVRRLLMAPSDEAVTQMLQENQGMIGPRFFAFLESLEEEARESGDEDVADQLADLHAKARSLAPSPVATEEEKAPQPEQKPEAPSEPPKPKGKEGPGGIIFTDKT